MLRPHITPLSPNLSAATSSTRFALRRSRPDTDCPRTDALLRSEPEVGNGSILPCLRGAGGKLVRRESSPFLAVWLDLHPILESKVVALPLLSRERPAN